MGLLDVLSAADLQYKLIGLAFAVAGLILFTGSAVLLRKRWWCTHGRVGAVAAGAAGTLVGGYLFVMQYQAPDLAPSRLQPFPAWVPWACVVVASVVGAVLGWWSTAKYADFQVSWTAIGGRLVAGGLSVTLLFGGVQWWYTQQYKPGTIGATLTVTAELKEVSLPEEAMGGAPGSRLFEGDVVLKNDSGTTVQIVSSQYVAVRIRHDPRDLPEALNEVDQERLAASCFFEELAPVTDPECRSPYTVRRYGEFDEDDPNAGDDLSVHRSTVASSSAVLQLGPVAEDGTWVEPKESIRENVLIPVPDDGQDAYLETLELRVTLAVAKGDRLVLQRTGGHGPEMLPRTVMGIEEYHDYRRADGTGPTSAPSDGEAGTEKVPLPVRDAYYEELIERVEAPVLAPGAQRPPPSPHRIAYTRTLIEPSSAVRRLVYGDQAVNTVQVLTVRQYNEFGPLLEVENPYLVVCTAPAEKGETAESLEEVRRDPTLACPGHWFDFRDEDRRLTSWEQEYQELVKYREDMDAFYGLVFAASSDVAKLTGPNELIEQQPELSAAQHDLHNISDVFRKCAPVLAFVDAVTAFGDKLQQAFDRHSSEMDVPTGRPVVDGAPSLHEGVVAADTLASYLDEAQSWLKYCGTTGELADDVVTGSGADYCLQTADAKSEALLYARDLDVAVREHHEVMLRYESGSITAEKAMDLGTPSLVAGAAAADGYRRAEDAADRMVNSCR
ncbi:hypothetical protein SAMN05660350_04543 [Geodermatophilus obscurus]|uniref:Uncharacterized protein n=1 Tax=Geodermatophilus obscurus TaxID=1861 RepID=A0A1M7UZU9_9ACTN|nr:hypothetical protein [Geodermatophilus obscurus]SHN88498.1 hypothetical protein SAMN05660350_04543 [Geodermatophilus obscurus]